MSDIDSSRIVSMPVGQQGSPHTNKPQKIPESVRFNRRELDAILRVYGQMVAMGQWRDYAIDHLKTEAVFSIFRHTAEFPLYRITKVPKLQKKQGMYAVVAASGMIMKRGHDLPTVLKVFDRQRLKPV